MKNAIPSKLLTVAPLVILVSIACFILFLFLLPQEHYELFGTIVILAMAFLVFIYIALRNNVRGLSYEEEYEAPMSNSKPASSNTEQPTFWAKAPAYLVLGFLIILLIGSYIFRVFYL